MDHDGRETQIAVVEERPLTIFLNGQEIVTAMMSHAAWNVDECPRDRPLRKTLFVIAPLASGMRCFLGLTQALGLELNLFNIVVVPSIMGIGIDYQQVIKGLVLLAAVLAVAETAITRTSRARAASLVEQGM